MSFGERTAHIAGPARNACTQASALTPPPLSAAIQAWTKDTVKIDVSKPAGGSVPEGHIRFLRQSHHGVAGSQR
jgi:hypothetical protein